MREMWAMLHGDGLCTVEVASVVQGFFSAICEGVRSDVLAFVG